MDSAEATAIEEEMEGQRIHIRPRREYGSNDGNNVVRTIRSAFSIDDNYMRAPAVDGPEEGNHTSECEGVHHQNENNSAYFDDDDDNISGDGLYRDDNNNHYMRPPEQTEFAQQPQPPIFYGKCRMMTVCVLLLFFAASVVMTVKTNQKKPGGAAYVPASDNVDDKSASGEEEETTMLCNDPIQSLRPNAALEGLENAAIASDHKECSKMGLEILNDKQGNAVDAAVTVALCLGVANPSSSGLGGGGFILIHSDPKDGQDGDDSSSNMPPFNDARTTERSPKSASGKVTEVIDCREVAPSAATTNMYVDGNNSPSSSSTYGGLSIPVPGELRGLELAHARYGRLQWSDVVEPVMRLAYKGLEVNQHLGTTIETMANKYGSNNNTYPDYGLRNFLTRGDSWSKPLRTKELLQNQKLGELLEQVMEKGADAMYVDHADQIAEEVKEAGGGILSAEDIQNYIPTIRTPVFSNDVFGFTIVGVPPPSSGGAAIIGAARLLTGYQTPLSSFPDTLSSHRIVEALKHAFAIRMSLSDPKYNTETVEDAVKDLTQGAYMDELRLKYSSDTTTMPLSKYGGTKWSQLNDTMAGSAINASDAQEGDRRRRVRYLLSNRQQQQQQQQEEGSESSSSSRKLINHFGYLNDGGTSHFSIIDKDGNSVAMTTSINTEFGSKVVSSNFGFVYSNTMDDFANPGDDDESIITNHYGLTPSSANYIQPGKIPLSSMSPTMVFRNSDDKGDSPTMLGNLTLVVGGSGGPKIITSVLQVILNKIILGKSMFESVVYPRLHDQLLYHGSPVTAVENSNVDDAVGEGIIGGTITKAASLVVSDRTKTALEKRGHDLLDVDYAGAVQAVAVDVETNLLTAVSDVRKGGTPSGY